MFLLLFSVTLKSGQHCVALLSILAMCDKIADQQNPELGERLGLWELF